MDIHAVRRRLLKENTDKDFKLPLFSLDPFDAPDYYKTQDDAAEGKKEKGRVPHLGYCTPRVDPDTVPDRVLGETPKKRATALRRAGDVTIKIINVD